MGMIYQACFLDHLIMSLLILSLKLTRRQKLLEYKLFYDPDNNILGTNLLPIHTLYCIKAFLAFQYYVSSLFTNFPFGPRPEVRNKCAASPNRAEVNVIRHFVL